MARASGTTIPKSKIPEESRSLILRAALQEFAQEGFAGARTEAIAKAAGVNIALIFYYFKNKEQLYGEALDSNYAEWNKRMLAALGAADSPRRKIKGYVSAHFDFVAETPSRSRLVLQEMMRKGRSGSPHILRLAKKYIRKVHQELAKVVREGTKAGDFNPLDPENFVYSVVGMINFYFACAPALKAVSGHEPLGPASITRRKAEVMRFITQALFAK